MELGGGAYVAALGVTFAATAVATPMLRRFALRRAIVDAPDGGRKTQDVAIPYLGGVGIVASTSLVLIVAAAVSANPATNLALLLGVLGPALVLSVVGLVDDMRGLTPGVRFLAQSAAAVVTAWLMSAAGTRGQLSGIFWVDTAITVLWVVGVTNALNLLDNMDGLAAGVAGIAGVAYFVIAASNGQYLIAALALSLTGACGGFLVWNRFPARIYMGDSGALFIGFMLAALCVRVQLDDAPRPIALLAPAAVLLLPVLDTSVVIVSRLRRGVSPFQGGRDHLSHRLQRLGFDVPNAVGRLYAVAAGAGAIAWVASRVSLVPGLGLLGAAGVAFVWLFVRALGLERTHPIKESS